MEPPRHSRRLLVHRLFDVGVWLKGIDGALEIVGGTLLLLASRGAISQLVAVLTQHELAEDPRDVIATALRDAASRLSPDTKLFGAAYLIGHGVVKVLLVAGLLRGKSWSYPAAMAFLSIFICYQLYRVSYRFSTPLLLLTILDAVIVTLIWREFRAARHVAEASGQPPCRKLG